MTDSKSPFTPTEEEHLRAAMKKDRARRTPTAEEIQQRSVALRAADHRSRFEAAETPSLRRVAGFVPFLTKLKPAATSKFSGYSFLAIFALPVVAACMIVFAAYVAASKISSTEFGPTKEKEEALAAIKQWWRKNIWGAFAAFGILIGLIALGKNPAMEWLIVASILSFGYLVTLLASAGLASRKALATTCFYSFFFAAQIANSFAMLMKGDTDSAFTTSALLFLYGFGAVICMALYPADTAAERAKKYLLIILAAVVALLVGGSVLRNDAPSLSEAKTQCDEFTRGIFSHDMWDEWDKTATWVKAKGGEVDYGRARALLKRSLNEPKGAPFTTLGPAFRHELVARSDAEALLAKEQFSIKQLVKERNASRRISSLEQREWLILALLQTRGLTKEEKDVLESRLIASWPKPEKFDALKDMVLVVDLLDRIDRPLKAEDYRERVHRALTDCWISETEGISPSGGFTLASKDLDHSNQRATYWAVVLMEKFGVPEGVNTRRVRSYLRSESSPAFFLASRHWMDMEAGIALNKLNENVGYRDRGFLGTLLAERLVIGISLTILLAVYAILKSSRMDWLKEEEPPVQLLDA